MGQFPQPVTAQSVFAGKQLGISLLGLLALQACSVPDYLCLAPNSTDMLSLESTNLTNDRSALAVDLLFVTSSAVAKQLGDIDAAGYFRDRQQWLLDHPTELQSRSFELVPGQSALDIELDPPCGVEAVYLFADYAAPGAHRLRLDAQKHARVSLTAQAMELIE